VSRFTTHLPFSTRMLIAVGKVNLFKVILLFCLIGVALYISGIYQETGANISLRRAGGAEAVLQHRTRLAENALGPIVYLRKGLLGQLQQSGANRTGSWRSSPLRRLVVGCPGCALFTLLVATAGTHFTCRRRARKAKWRRVAHKAAVFSTCDTCSLISFDNASFLEPLTC
jgi:hypothetical protein